MGVANLNGMLYAVGGECEGSKSYEPTQYLDTVECYNPKTNLWMTKSKMSQPRSFAAIAVLNGVYIRMYLHVCAYHSICMHVYKFSVYFYIRIYTYIRT